MGLVELTSENFEKEVIQSELPTLIDFYKDGCGVCDTLAGYLEKLIPEYDGRVKFTKCNIKENPQIASRYKIQWPTQIAMAHKDRILGGFPGGKGTSSGQIADSMKEDFLRDRINSLLGRI